MALVIVLLSLHQKLMARVFQISTSLSFNAATTNIIELGQPTLITISNSQNVSDIEASISRDQ